ncbi:subtilisin-like protein [Xylariaceae sp. FL1272]|nr:subtilisin-like protein [Xylariaceae sp. FL1272]
MRLLSTRAATASLAAAALFEAVAGRAVRANHYIVEFASSTNALSSRDSFAAKGGIRMHKTFASTVFTGASIETELFSLDDLNEMPEVANVWRNNIVTLDALESQPRKVEPYKALDYVVHNATGVSQLHDAGVFGEGALVGTGAWYEHPALGGCFGPECKIVGGYDLVGDWHPGLEKLPDDDPKDNQGHGTHVSGIVAGENQYWSGVAPKAKLRAYKVFSDADGPESDDATVIEAFLMAAEDGCDIITCSIGNFNGWPQNAWAVVADRLVNDGVFVSISAGNEGSAGPFFGSTGASGKNVLAVASIAGQKLPAKSWQAIYSPVSGAVINETEAYLPVGAVPFPTSASGLEIVSLTLDTTVADDACDPFPADRPTLEGSIALVRRGSCTFVQKVTNLAAIGAQYVLFYNNEAAITTPQTIDGVLAAMVEAEVGAKIIEIVKAGGSVSGDFASNTDMPSYVDWSAGGKASDFTSWGALNDLSVKPDVGAPGGQIYSTYLANSYAILSGTSMACPYVAGVAALWVGQHGGRATQEKGWARALGRRIISSGQTLPWWDGASTDGDFTAPVEQVGTGLVDSWKVLNYDTQLEFQAMALNDTKHFNGNHEVLLTNNGDKDITYTFSHVPAAGFETYECVAADDCRIKPWTNLSPVSLEVDVNLPESITLAAGMSQIVDVTFENPREKGWNADEGSTGEQLSVPYFGLGSDLKEIISPVYRKNFPITVSGTENVTIEENAAFTFESEEFPRITARLKWGSAQVRWDIFESNWTEYQWKWPLKTGKNGYVGTVQGIDKSTGGVDYPNVTVTFPVPWVHRNADEDDWQINHEYWWPEGKLGDGNKIAPGNYTMRFAVLNPFGDPKRKGDWSVYKTPKITVLP